MKRGAEMGRIDVEVEIANKEDIIRAKDGHIPPEKVRRMRVKGVIDTGANFLVLPSKVVQQMGFPTAGQVGVRFADGRRDVRDQVDMVELGLAGRQSTFSAIVEPGRDDALIGAIVMEALDLLADCGKQIVHPRDPNRILAEIE